VATNINVLVIIVIIINKNNEQNTTHNNQCGTGMLDTTTAES